MAGKHLRDRNEFSVTDFAENGTFNFRQALSTGSSPDEKESFLL
jgi:hypothetical protein